MDNTPSSRQKLMRDIDIRKEEYAYYADLSDEKKLEKVEENIKFNYHIVGRNAGKYVDGEISENPYWIVKEKNHLWRPYDSTFIILYCHGGKTIYISKENFEEITTWANNNFAIVKIYVVGNEIKGTCINKPEDNEGLNNLLSSFYKYSYKKAIIYEFSV
jgi:hypothetical protein